MNLDTPDKTIEIVLGEAMVTANCDITAAYAIVATDAFLLAASDLVSNGTTPVTVVPAPTLPPGAGAQQNQVKEIRLHNNDTVTHQVTLRLNNGGTIRIMESEAVASGGDFLYTPEAPAAVSAAAPAILLESGTTGAKISALPAFDLTAPPTGAEPLPAVEGGATVRITLAQLYTLFAAWLDFVATSPLDAPGGSGNAGQEIFFQGGSGDGVGAGGGINILGGDAPDIGAGGQAVISGGSSANGTGGDTLIKAGTGLVSSGNVLMTGLPLSDPSIASVVWTSNDHLVLSGANIAPITSTVASGSAVALVTGTAKDVTTISVPAGNWTITGAVYFTGNAATTVTLVQGSVGTVANTLDTTPGQFDTEYLAGATLTVLGADPALLGFSADVTLGSTTTYRLDAKATFAINTLSAYGTIRAVPRA